jgi:hypothetical protein
VAFPVVRSATSSVQTVDQTNQPHTIASTVVAGDLLIELIALDTNVGLTWPAGWTVLPNVGSLAQAAIGMHARYKTADGTEGGTTITPVSGNNQKSVGISLCISGSNLTPEGTGVDSAGGSGPNPPNMVPSWGAADTLWIAGFGRDDGRGSAVAYPANYTVGQTFRNEGTAGGTALQIARRTLNAASEDPAAFGSVSNPNRAFTIAIQPAAIITTGFSIAIMVG